MRSSKKRSAADVVQLEAEPAATSGAVIGRVVSITGPRDILVDFIGNSGDAAPAMLAIPGARGGEAGLTEGARVVLVFEGGDEASPIIVGVVQTALASVEAALDRADVVARVDGKRVELEGNDEVVLKCGKASITLRRNGRVVIKGTYVETRAEGVHRIKGGSVLIN